MGSSVIPGSAKEHSLTDHRLDAIDQRLEALLPLGTRTSCPRGGLEALPPSGSPPTRPNKGLRYPGAGLDQSVSGCVAASVVSKDGK